MHASQRPARPTRRRAALIAALGLVAGGLTTAGLIGTAQAAAPTVALQYKTTTGGATADETEPWFTVSNTGSSPLALSRVAIRYYFTADGSSPYQFSCAWAVVGCSNVTGHVVALASPTATADHYLEVDFGSGAGTLAPGASTQDLQLRLWRQDWQSVNQADDYSFKAGQTSYGPNTAVTVSVDGAIVSGTAPGGNPTAPPTTTPPTTAPPTTTPPTSPPPTSPPPSGAALFDDFHYTGASDPNIAAHGWAIRTGAGGPGVADTWSASTFSFPSDSTAQGGKVMDLTASTDGTSAGTKQAEIDTTGRKFFEGTYAARVYFNDAPTTGQNGDHVNETFYTITPDDSLYSEDDFEYLPNGGWGGPANSMYTTSWYSSDAFDRVTNDTIGSLQGWHTLVETVSGGTVTYYIDGTQVFSSSGKYYPREKMTIDFNEWFIDLPFNGARTWDEKVNWVYYSANTLTPAAVTSVVNGYYAAGTHFTDTVPN
ncbi:cellulose binding domain-containing protein [Streptacidiphilus sp. N1-3]|uniref:Cellulose binding domain-containing protein n=1 Tax=Streptacidiphilus alkalitolerans TaxID=3342712 RepID=A0ABV6WWJ8_9ACTN